MISPSVKAGEVVCLITSTVCLILSVFWIVFFATFRGSQDLSAFYILMLGLCLPFGPSIGPFAAAATAVLVGFLSAFNIFRSDRPAIRAASRILLITQGIMTVVWIVVIAVPLTVWR